jgi:hypothetical protein
MWNPIESYRQRQARRRIMPHARGNRTGVTTKVALIVLALILLVAALLEWRGGGVADQQLVEAVRQRGANPVELVIGGARAHRFVFLGDVTGSALPKRFAVSALEALAQDPGLDAVALAIDSELQPIIDRYLDSNPEDASILLARPRALREWEGTGREYLDVYRTIWRLNRELGADRRIRIFAIDMAGWPAESGRSPAQLARLYGQRDSAMAANIEEQLLERDPRSRVFFFVDALNALKIGGAQIQTGGAGRVETEWLAARLRTQHPGEVFTVLLDVAPGRAVPADVAAYGGTRFYDALRRSDALPARFGVRQLDAFDDRVRPIRTVTGAGISADLYPQDYRLRDVADVYVLLGS